MTFSAPHDLHGYHPTDDAVAGGVGQEGPADRSAFVASRLLQPVQPPGLYPAPVVRADGAGDIAQARSSRHRGGRRRLVRRPRGDRLEEGSSLLDALQGAAAPLEKSLFHRLLDAVFADAVRRKLVGTKEEASVD